jgi:hypothetical protein
MNVDGVVPLVLPGQFIQATRDSGYKGLASALAELVDNSFEASARKVLLTIEKVGEGVSQDVRVTVADNGRGMDDHSLRHALQFGWSSRFNQRNGHGRYGMGLSNASLSQARRVEVYSSSNGQIARAVSLDVDDVILGDVVAISPLRSVAQADFRRVCPFRRGTAVIWTKCDRLVDTRFGFVTRRLRADLGRLFRYQLWSGKQIIVNDERVMPFDPLFERPGMNLRGARIFGPELEFEVETSSSISAKAHSVIRVRFTELPVNQWCSLSNDEKNAKGIAKNAGVSIVRAGREIDHGWFFMGAKRKENYDDWWRCEVRFEPDLDELFGVTHTKQEIRPAENLLVILSPDIERTARELNSRARQAFLAVKNDGPRRESEKVAERHDNLIEPPRRRVQTPKTSGSQLVVGARPRVGGLAYRILIQSMESTSLYQVQLSGSRVTITLNAAHPFIRQAYGTTRKGSETDDCQKSIELMIIAAARAELSMTKSITTNKRAETFLERWSNILATFLS